MNIENIINQNDTEIQKLIEQFEKLFTRLASKAQNEITLLFKKGIYDATQVSTILDKYGYSDLCENFTDQYKKLFKYGKMIATEMNFNFILSENSLYLLEQYAASNTLTLLTQKDYIASTLVRSGLQGVVEGKDLRYVITDLNHNIEDATRRLSAEANTGISNFNRLIKSEEFKAVDLDLFYYAGVRDEFNRKECRKVLDDPRQKTGWTREDIAASPVDFITGGGWNCRHQFLPFIKKEISEEYIDFSENTPRDNFNYQKNIIEKQNIKIPDKIFNALKNYKGMDYREINHYLRTGELKKKGIDGIVNKIKKGFKNYTTENTTVWRGAISKEWVNLFDKGNPIGIIINEKGFLSTTMDYNLAKRFAQKETDSIIFKIKVSKNTNCAFMESIKDTGESEILFKNNSKLKITKKYIEKIPAIKEKEVVGFLKGILETEEKILRIFECELL